MKNSEREFIEKQIDSILSEGTYSEGKPHTKYERKKV